MKRKILLTVYTLALLLINTLGSCISIAQDQTNIYIEEVVVQSIYVEGCNGSIILKTRFLHPSPDIEAKVYIRKIDIDNMDEFNISIVNEKNISTKEFVYYIYTIYINTNRKTPSKDVNSLCKPLILNISLIGQKNDLNILYDNKLTIITVCSVKALETLRIIMRSVEDLVKNNAILRNSLGILENKTTTIINAISKLEKDMKRINDSIAIRRDDLGRILENQDMLRLLVCISLASSFISLSLLIILITLILRTRKEQLILGL